MSCIRFAAIIGIVLGLSDTGAFADQAAWDGSKLYAECRKKSALCAAYLTGVSDFASKESGLALPSAAVCFPEGTSARQIRDVVLRQLETYPQGRSEEAVYIALTAMKEAWPCPQ